MLGEGIIKGMAETARNFVGSYVSKDRLTTVQYPEERLPAKEATRQFPFLVFDGDDWENGASCATAPDGGNGLGVAMEIDWPWVSSVMQGSVDPDSEEYELAG